MDIIKLDPTSKSVREIIDDIDGLMNALYPQESNQLLSIEALQEKDVHFIGVIKNQDILGCGALVYKNNDGVYGELKRIYVKPEYRGQGISNVIMQELISYAAINQLHIIRLEAGIRQPEALSLYKKLGFKERKEYGSYQYDPLSIYMELSLCETSYR
ncbi:MAG: GNAT family N-acetyltransferase [Oceanospirillales bacterium]|nr:GNAT family N-acetyltransferase [Oceanospirillales bacterium]MBR9887950.1 GNAT family N-acetyltransferase [Oceanospirillales bacterium]